MLNVQGDCASLGALHPNTPPRLTIVFLGEGAAQNGRMAETLNAAAKEKLPLLFLVIDNGRAINTFTPDVAANSDVYLQVYYVWRVFYPSWDTRVVAFVSQYLAIHVLRSRILGLHSQQSCDWLDSLRLCVRHGHTEGQFDQTLPALNPLTLSCFMLFLVRTNPTPASKGLSFSRHSP